MKLTCIVFPVVKVNKIRTGKCFLCFKKCASFFYFTVFLIVVLKFDLLV